MVTGKKSYKIIFAVLFLLCHIDVAVGQWQIGANVGYGSYALGDLKELQQEIIDGLPVAASITSSLPSFWYYEFSLTRALKPGFRSGLTVATGSTGGRVYYSDYSGEVGSDQLLRFTSLIVNLAFQKNFGDNKCEFSFDIRPGVTFTSFQLISYQTINGAAMRDELGLKSTTISMEPTFGLTRYIFGNIGLCVKGGYHLSLFPGALKVGGGTLVVNGSEANADWSGFRFSVGISYRLGSMTEFGD